MHWLGKWIGVIFIGGIILTCLGLGIFILAQPGPSSDARTAAGVVMIAFALYLAGTDLWNAWPGSQES